MNELIGVGRERPTPPLRDEQHDVDVFPARKGNYGIDVMIPAHGKVDLTMRAVKSLYEGTQTPFHLIICDDAPPDDEGLTEHWVRKLQANKGNVTYCLSRIPYKCGNTFFNVALRYARTEYLATVMNSVTVEPLWEVVALQLMQTDPLIGCIGFKCLFPNGTIESAGIQFVGHIPADVGRDLPGYRMNEVREAEAIQWAFALHRRKALEGNLDENLFHGHVGWDDIDNTLAVKAKGWKIIYCGQGVGIHYPRSTRGSASAEAAVKNQQNAHTFFKRWGLWEKYLEGTKMDVGAILKYETKARLTDSVMTMQVLRKLLDEATQVVQMEANAALKELGADDKKYQLEMNPMYNQWLLKPCAKAVLEQTVKPAGDTQITPPVMQSPSTATPPVTEAAS